MLQVSKKVHICIVNSVLTMLFLNMEVIYFLIGVSVVA